MSYYNDLIHQFTDTETGKTWYCVASWNARAAKLERPLDSRESRLSGCWGMSANRNAAGMEYLGAFPTRRQALHRARTLYGPAR